MEKNYSSNAPKAEYYAVEIDGIRRLEKQTFSEAIKAAMEMKQKKPGSHVLLRGEETEVSYDEQTLACD